MSKHLCRVTEKIRDLLQKDKTKKQPTSTALIGLKLSLVAEEMGRRNHKPLEIIESSNLSYGIMASAVVRAYIGYKDEIPGSTGSKG